MKIFIAVLCVAALARAQIPSLGFCPEYLPMAGFDMERFSGIWFEAERYFQLNEVASRCVKSNYTRGPDGKYRVLNEVTSIFTGIKRVVEGEIRKAPSKAEEGRLNVKYTSVPLIPLETQYNVLETDYKNYAVLWSCSGIGPVHTQNAWIMTRKRTPAGEILQKAYGVLDKYKISKLFFMKTNQEDCAYLDSLDAEQNLRPPADEPQKTDSEDSEEAVADDVPQPLKAAEPVKEQVKSAGPVDAKDSVVSAVKNAAAAVKQAAAAIRSAAIAKPAEKKESEPVQSSPVVAPAVEPASVPAAEAAAPTPKEHMKSVIPEVIAEKPIEPAEKSAGPIEVKEAVQPAQEHAKEVVQPAQEHAKEAPVEVVDQKPVEEKKN